MSSKSPIDLLVAKIVMHQYDELGRLNADHTKAEYYRGYQDGLTAGKELGWVMAKNQVRRSLELEPLPLPNVEINEIEKLYTEI